MTTITKPATRAIIDSYAKEICEKRLKTAKPSTHVINFRTDMQDGNERTIWRAPIEILRYRKDNGRIASDVMDYEENIGILSEDDVEAQEMIAKFLEEKDPEKTIALRSSIFHSGQLEPAIITCDGFLINGNRRKMVMDKLHREYPQDEKYSYMKVVILPGRDDEGGPPTLLEIEKIENRYQLQSEGKADYYGFDRALSIKRKIELGFPLEDQLRDDPRYAEKTSSQLEKVVREYERQYLHPLERVERYLRQFKREGQYRVISTGTADPEGRWQAFIDYSATYSRYFNNPKKLIEYGIDEVDIGSIEEAAFDIIRLRVIPDMPKVHMIMRNLPKYCRTEEGRKHILKIPEEVEPVLPSKECTDEEGNQLSFEEIERKWATKNKQNIIYNIKKAAQSHEIQKEMETPLGLLEAAYKKLTHENMDPTTMSVDDYRTALKLAAAIKDRTNELEDIIYSLEKQYKPGQKRP